MQEACVCAIVGAVVVGVEEVRLHGHLDEPLLQIECGERDGELGLRCGTTFAADRDRLARRAVHGDAHVRFLAEDRRGEVVQIELPVTDPGVARYREEDRGFAADALHDDAARIADIGE